MKAAGSERPLWIRAASCCTWGIGVGRLRWSVQVSQSQCSCCRLTISCREFTLLLVYMVVVTSIDWDGRPCPMTLATLRALLSDEFEQRLRRLTSSFQICGDSEPCPLPPGARLLVTKLVVRAVVRPARRAALRELLEELASALGGTLRSPWRSPPTFHAADSSEPTRHQRGTHHPRAGPRWPRA